MLELQIEIPEFMKKRVKVLKEKECEVCKKVYKVIKVKNSITNEDIISEDCPHCRIEAENEAFRKDIEEKRIKSMLARCERHSEIPFDLEGATFQSYEPQNKTQKDAKETSMDFANDNYEKTTLFFQGDTGLGKTHLSYCVYKAFVNNRKGAIFTDLPSLLSKIRNTFNSGNDYRAMTQEKIMQEIGNCELFILDDIGAEYVKPDANGFESWAADILFQIANARQGKKNIYTTNFTSKYLNRKYGMMSKRIISRLMSNAKVIKVEGSDHRLKGLE